MIRMVTVYWYCLGCGKSGQTELAVQFRGPEPSIEERISYLAGARHEIELAHRHDYSDVKLIDPYEALSAAGFSSRGKNWIN